ncbi:MAG: TonB family protein [Gemmatimonadales bacterium]
MFCSRCGEQVDTSSRFCPRCGEDLSKLTTGAGKPGATAPLSAQPPQEDETAIVREALKDEYELEKELGRGGMAVVYKARDKQLEREVAIKVLPFSLSFDAEFVERFQREARTAGKLEHPNIIPIYRVGRAGRVIYFCMKFIRGKSLTDKIEARGAIPVPELKRLLIESARALGYAHKHGIVHRDIKPDNIMFDELGQAIVADFGIAKAQSGAKLTGTGMSIGTPHYMSPEQARAQNLDGRSDIYSLGVVAYQCLTGHVPFDGEDSFSIGYKHIMEELPVPALEQADQREMFTIIQKMMAKKPDDRFQTAEEVVAAMEGGAMPIADLATMPTRAIEPQKAPAKGAKPAGGPPPAIATAATTPLPRASASMGVPKDVAAARAAGAGAAPPPAKPALKPKETGKKKSSGGLIAAVVILALAGAALGGYLMFMRPQQVAVVPPVAPPINRDSAAAADSAKAAAAAAAAAESTKAEATSSKRDRNRRTREESKKTVTPPPAAHATGTGTISLNNLRNNATVRVDGEVKRGDHIKVPAGVSHQIQIDAQGFQSLNQSVTVANNQTLRFDATMRPAGTAPPPGGTPGGSSSADCASSPNIFNNSSNHCFDTRPVPQTLPQATAPTTCRSNVGSATLMVKISAQGEVMDQPTVMHSSGCPAFDDVAKAAIQDIAFVPAKKGGQPVIGWLQVPMRPTH